MSKDRSIQILQHNIDELEIKIYNFNLFNISPKKTERLITLKQKYEDQLDALLQQ